MYHPPDFVGPVLFSFRPKAFFGKKKASIKAEDSEWSNKFSLDVAGSSGSVSCKSNNNLSQVNFSKEIKVVFVLKSNLTDWGEHKSFKLKSNQAGDLHSVLHGGEPHFVHDSMPRRRSASRPLDGHRACQLLPAVAQRSGPPRQHSQAESQGHK